MALLDGRLGIGGFGDWRLEIGSWRFGEEGYGMVWYGMVWYGMYTVMLVG
jgi:hypothetical protein